MKKDIVLSGIRPTGRLHIGNYFGSLQNFIKLQNEYECFFFIADLHSLNEPFDAKTKYDQIINLAADYLAVGLDPEKCTIFVQSQISCHAELALILNNIIPVAYLFRMTQYKEKASDRNAEKINAGLLFYPVLMAADILLYRATKVPVGSDQTQHVELTRTIAHFFNNQFGQTFTEPVPLYTATPKVSSLVEPTKKMSKSLGDNHCLYLDDEPEIIAQKLARAPTDTGNAQSAGAKNLLALAKIFCPPPNYQNYLRRSQEENLKYAELKKDLAQSIGRYFAEYRQAKKQLLKNPKKIEKILAQGTARAQKIAGQTLLQAKIKIGLAK